MTYYVHVFFGKEASGCAIDVNVERERERSPDSRHRAVAPAAAT